MRIRLIHKHPHIELGLSQPDLVPIPHTPLRRAHGYIRTVCGVLILNILETFAQTPVCVQYLALTQVNTRPERRSPTVSVAAKLWKTLCVARV